MFPLSRRQFLRTTLAAASTTLLPRIPTALAQSTPSPRAPQDKTIQILHPQARVPLSFFIDDSTCLVNMGHFCMPQFAEAWPQRQEYKKPWQTWPREIPDAFLREFGQFCAENSVKGKFSIVPYPACVGWLDREIPGWSRRQLQDSLKLVRELMLPNWDIHPEMISHTRVIDLKTGRPFEEISSATMENSFPQSKISVDELASYLAYALRILKNCGLPCEGITTPGGFGNAVKAELPIAAGQALRDVFAAEIPHYFKYVANDKESTEPKLEHLQNADTDAPQLTVSVPAATGDWFGNWDGDAEPQGHLYANADATAGRMVQLIERNDPAIMLCHWPGLYNHGAKTGFTQFQQVARALNTRFRDRTIWMKISEIARYWAARQLTRIDRTPAQITLTAPFAAPSFTVQISNLTPPLNLSHNNQPISLKSVSTLPDLKPNTYFHQDTATTLCFNLPQGRTVLTL
jgi:hypothetical protein